MIVCYTDGGCRGNPGPGAWAFVLIDLDTGNAFECTDGDKSTTNNRMEMLAAINAMEALRKPGTSLTIYSDSQYLIDCCTKWMPKWKLNNWKRKGGPLKNVDLLKRLDDLQGRHQITWKWVKGHAGNAGNEHVDDLLNAAMDKLCCGRSPRHEHRFTWTKPIT